MLSPVEGGLTGPRPRAFSAISVKRTLVPFSSPSQVWLVTVGPSSLLSPLVVLVRISRSMGLPLLVGSVHRTSSDRSPNSVTGAAGWPGTSSGVHAGLGGEKAGSAPVPSTASFTAPTWKV